jgi:hypothetical protein
MRAIIEQYNGAEISIAKYGDDPPKRAWNVRTLRMVSSGTAVTEDAARTAAR